MPQIIIAVIIIVVVFKALEALFEALGKMISALFVMSGWALYSMTAMVDRLFGAWGNWPAISWGGCGLVLGSTVYFMLHESRKLSRPRLNTMLVTMCSVLLIAGPLVGYKTRSNNLVNGTVLPSVQQADASKAKSNPTTVKQKAVKQASSLEQAGARGVGNSPAKPAAESAESSPSALFEKGKALYGSDQSAAANYFLNAAQKGHVKAQRNLGALYYSGNGVHQNHVEAAKWYRKAAEKGDPESQFFLSYMLYNGEGLQANEDEGKKWLTRAARQGHVEAKKRLAMLTEGSN